MTRIDLVYNIIKDFNDMPKPAQIHMLKMLADDLDMNVLTNDELKSRTSGTYQTAYGQKFKELYDTIECNGKPIRGSKVQLTPSEFGKVVKKAHTYAKEQRALGYPDVR